MIVFFGIIILIYIIYLKFNSSQINPIEKYELIQFQKQWNKDLPRLKERITKGEFDNIKAEKSKWERYKKPYTKPLPEFPDMRENNSTLYGIDSNNNGVRDDLEILAVKEFWNDRDVVEVVFAGIRANDYDIYLYKNNLINYKTIDEILRRVDIYVPCYIKITSDFNRDEKIYKKYNNTPERKKVEKIILKNLGGHIGHSQKTTKEFCKKWIEESKSWIYRNK